MKKIILIFALLLQACGGGSGGGEAPVNGDAYTVADIKGIWRTGCFTSLVNNQPTYAMRSLTFTDSLLFDDWNYFSDSACTQTQVMDASVWTGATGAYKILGSANTTNGIPATEIEYTYTGNNINGNPVVIEFVIHIDGDTLYQGFKDNGAYTLNYQLPYNFSGGIYTGSYRVFWPILLAYAGVDSLPLDGNDFVPMTVIPNANIAAMADNDTAVSAYTASASTSDHSIIIRVGNSPVDQIYLYTDIPLGTDWTGLNGLQLYSNSVINTSNWSDESAAISSMTYDDANRRYEIELNLLQRNYFKLHFNNTFGQDMHITEVEVSQLVTFVP